MAARYAWPAWWGQATQQHAAAQIGTQDDLCIYAPATPYDRASGHALTAARKVPSDARCPVCGMYPARSPDWAAQVIFSNGDAHFFDSPLSMFQYLQDVGRYSQGRTAADIVAMYVTDAEVGGWIAAQGATYVSGSSALGPMRAGNLPPFATPQAAARFAERRGGRTWAFAEIDEAVVRDVAPPAAHRH